MTLIFFFENAENLGRSDNGKQRKKGIVLEVKTLTWLKMVRASFPVLLRFWKELHGIAHHPMSWALQSGPSCSKAD